MVKKMKKKIVFDLDPDEQNIEDQLETFVPASAETAGECGLPYQTFITMVLHKYVTDQFVDRNEVKKLW
ncbi:hypothetical protein NO2_0041 [Candidatus Termititenax persephonae]|uniref:Uncharacterized protein n=1 Tax=Candidatus Termititenax persephonae TaxID=2218525 RepID=A0A388TFG6_9BACT|nr:hypothetical protein NO2_0041 [Candidatus Termititenax persephonae]